MNQKCKVCGEPAAGFHFGAFTCEGCKSFFGRTYSNLTSVGECKNGGSCVINKKNRTSCKSCRLRKCLLVGMSKNGSRYGRRSNWFKIHCLLQEHNDSFEENIQDGARTSASPDSSTSGISSGNGDEELPEFRPMFYLNPTLIPEQENPIDLSCNPRKRIAYSRQADVLRSSSTVNADDDIAPLDLTMKS